MKKSIPGLRFGGELFFLIDCIKILLGLEYIMYVILVYDIVTDEQGKKNLPIIFKKCKKYLVHIQNSVFEGNITLPKITALKNELKPYIRKDKDSVIVFTAREERWLKKEFLGTDEDKTSRFI